MLSHGSLREVIRLNVFVDRMLNVANQTDVGYGSIFFAKLSIILNVLFLLFVYDDYSVVSIDCSRSIAYTRMPRFLSTLSSFRTNDLRVSFATHVKARFWHFSEI